MQVEAEYTVHRTEDGTCPNDDGGEHDDGARLFDEGPAPLPHGAQDVDGCGHMVRGKLHDEGGWLAAEGLGLLEHDTRHHDGGDTDEVAQGSHPPGVSKEGGGDHGDDGKLGAAGDEGGGDDRHAAVGLANPPKELTTEEKVAQAMQVVCPISKFGGKTLGEVLREDPKAIRWVAEKYPGSEETRAAAKLICEYAMQQATA